MACTGTVRYGECLEGSKSISFIDDLRAFWNGLKDGGKVGSSESIYTSEVSPKLEPSKQASLSLFSECSIFGENCSQLSSENCDSIFLVSDSAYAMLSVAPRLASSIDLKPENNIPAQTPEKKISPQIKGDPDGLDPHYGMKPKGVWNR